MRMQWARVANRPALRLAEVHVWVADIGVEQSNGYEPVLSAQEIARANRFTSPRARSTYICSHGILRKLIGAYLGLATHQVNIRVSSNGKPGLPETDLCFSISHTDELVLLAFALNVDLGVDIECIDLAKSHIELGGAVFTNRELHLLAQFQGVERARAFCYCWTRKEAYAKCLGVGLDGLNSVEIGLREGELVVEGVYLQSFEWESGFVASLATQSRLRSTKFLRWPPEHL